MRTSLRKAGTGIKIGTTAVALIGVAACGSSAKTATAPAAAPTTAATTAAGATGTTGTTSTTPAAAAADLCPNGKIQFGIEPYEDATKLTPAYKTVADALSKALNCPVNLQITESYAAEVLAMQNGKLDIGEFGPLGYVFASNMADAQPVASFATADGKLSTYTAGIWVPTDSKIMSLADLKGHTLALSSAGSTSGDAYPRYALMTAGLGTSDVKTIYAGGHPQSLLALTNGKTDAGEINSQEEATAIAAKTFDPAKYREIWKSEDIPNDPITVYGKESPAFQAAVKAALLSLTPDELTAIGGYLGVDPAGPMLAVTKDNYSQLFDLAAKLHLTTKDL